jgi:hypothetical protein
MKKAFLSLTFVFLLSTPVYALDTTHVGFVSSPLWFDREPFFAGQSVRVYTMLTNSSSADFSATVEFRDVDTVIGTSNVTLAKNGGFQVVWIDWTPNEGDHTISASVTNATLTEPGGTPQSVTYSGSSASAPKRFVDTDTDEDGIGNRDDLDDDNDGIPDAEDSEPLVVVSVKEQQALLTTSKDVGTVLQTLIATTTPKIVATTQSIVSALDTFRTNQGNNILEQAGNVKKEIEEAKEFAQTSGEEVKTDPISQIKLLALTTAGYTLSNTILFYIVFAVLGYLLLRKILPWIFRKFRGKSEFE